MATMRVLVSVEEGREQEMLARVRAAVEAACRERGLAAPTVTLRETTREMTEAQADAIRRDGFAAQLEENGVAVAPVEVD